MDERCHSLGDRPKRRWRDVLDRFEKEKWKIAKDRKKIDARDNIKIRDKLSGNDAV